MKVLAVRKYILEILDWSTLWLNQLVCFPVATQSWECDNAVITFM